MIKSSRGNKPSELITWSGLLAIFGAVMQALPQVQQYFGHNYGIIFIAVAGITGYLRTRVKGPLK